MIVDMLFFSGERRATRLSNVTSFVFYLLFFKTLEIAGKGRLDDVSTVAVKVY